MNRENACRTVPAASSLAGTHSGMAWTFSLGNQNTERKVLYLDMSSDDTPWR